MARWSSPMSCVPPRGVTGGWRARTQEVKRSSAARADEDDARRRQGRLEWDGTHGGEHEVHRRHDRARPAGRRGRIQPATARRRRPDERRAGGPVRRRADARATGLATTVVLDRARGVRVRRVAGEGVRLGVLRGVWRWRGPRDRARTAKSRRCAAPPDERRRGDHKTKPGRPGDRSARARLRRPGRPRARRPTGRSRSRSPPPTRSFCAASASTRSSPDELAQLYRLMSQLADGARPLRRTRRARRDHHGERIDLRRTLRGSLRTGGDPIRLARRRRRVRAPADGVAVRHLGLDGALRTRVPAVSDVRRRAAGPRSAEAFVFATRLTRVTRALASRNPERAIQRAAAAAPDWSSGTRIGEALKAFNDRHGRRGNGARGGDRDPVRRLGARRSDARRPRDGAAGAPRAPDRVGQPARRRRAGFSPRTGGMAAALPHCDALVSGHSLEALDDVVDGDRRRRAVDRRRLRPAGRGARRARGGAVGQRDARSPAARWRCRAATARAEAGRHRAGDWGR